MFRPLFLTLLLLSIVLVACNNTDETDEESTSIPPSPTSLLASSYNGPLLNPLNDSNEEDCSVGSDCGLSVATNIETAVALPLVSMTWNGLQIGVPEGFESLDFDTRLSMEALDGDAHPGSFRVSLRWTDADGATALLNSYTNIDTSVREQHPNQLGDGYIITNSDVGVVGVWTLPDERVVVIEGFVQPGYWPRYAATYMAIVDNIQLADS